MVTLRVFADALLAALLAPPCAACARPLDRPLAGAVCDACWTALAPRPSPFTLARIARAAAIGPYEGPLRALLHALKYDGRRSIAPRLGSLMAVHGRDVLAGADVAVPVPLHPRRLRERGFNQADDLARGLGVPVRRALCRVRATRPQVDLPAAARAENVRGAFATGRRWGAVVSGLSPGAPPRLAGRVIVLVDDVTTTGATLEACAQALYGAGAKEVRALTAARVVTARRS